MYSQIDKMGSKYHSLQTDIWLHHDLFSAGWLSIVIINIVFLILFILLIDRYRTLLISFAFMVSFLSVGIANEIGSYFDFWSYPHQFLVFTHRFNAVDFSVMPVIMTLTYQYFSKWKPYFVATVIMSAIICFIGVPIFVILRLYKLENWNYFYSFLVTLLMFVIMKMIVDFVNNRSKKQ
ncbi:CBO0543 family protein [Neobacillus sp. SuZ13]|uniref:CBO0543 family protein n=1 Tax=Neobacillus sp. SuZ13 TaxID=3047875 RepID=UPI0024C003E2|nr:CBO0543 family protein [Neobacillus sp. SuZ13]WHY69818.1 CBO0543 family protein [Neobacillus sp. SuZ13]